MTQQSEGQARGQSREHEGHGHERQEHERQEHERREHERREHERSAGVRLARLLRRWWEESGGPSGGTRPTQQALAARLGVDQTTLSRYLNPGHLSTAPARVVEALHSHLRAPAAELDEARALCAAVLRENRRQRTAGDGRTERTEPPDTAGPADGKHDMPAAVPAAAVPAAAGPPGTGMVRPASRWLPSVLVGALVVMAFTAGVAVHAWFSASDRETPADGTAVTVAPRAARHEWPLLTMGEEDQFTRARAVQYLLRSWGYRVRIDGFFREETRNAVRAFQTSRLLPADGKVGDRTWPELVREVGPGSRPFEVRAVQELLNHVGQAGIPVSGTFTTMTADALGYFQRAHDLPETRRADADTWLALLVRQRPPAAAPDGRTSVSPPPAAAD
jgi:hypothetical protein